MPTPSNYPPGVSGNEPEITGYGDEPFDVSDYDQDFYIVHKPCGEAFDDLKIGHRHANSGDCPNYEKADDLDDWSILPESEVI